MLEKIIRAVITIIGLGLGFEVSYLSFNVYRLQDMVNLQFNSITVMIICILSSIIGGVIFFILFPNFAKLAKDFEKLIETALQKVSIYEILIGGFGLIVGLILANLISIPIYQIYILGKIIPIILNIFLGYLGINVFLKKKEEISNLFTMFKKIGPAKVPKIQTIETPKILDTSVIIDGRIFDICKTGFVEGPLIIPNFVLEELRHIADSSDSLKRNRGRRGLDILNRIQKELDIKVQIIERETDAAEVDTKLLRLAKLMNGKVITNDYNLNKVAEFQGVPVLNINELSNAVKPVVLPGEEMMVQIIKDGKESGQGIAYLDDGTMIVVDSGRKHIGDTLEVIVTSVLQTAAGRMIFAKPKNAEQEKAM
ncbi:PIN/TRAM domain-containing protein [Aceticella autotrophica]|uniref:PIN/TRAM domain-containing protein n=1 Tax=Aceticella autotrophica TaxID=2755338 RepID=A0A975AVF4_9THEO|nr:PIN/TRAM domain-containing protein [Aceticella autotrophica]QSZ27185.1 PIN/TRAM domain-containing protein [Aceticella autotrophica]